MRQPTCAGPVHATPALRMVRWQQREAPPGCAPHPLPPQLPSHSASPPQQALPFAVPSEHHSLDIATGAAVDVATGAAVDVATGAAVDVATGAAVDVSGTIAGPGSGTALGAGTGTVVGAGSGAVVGTGVGTALGTGMMQPTSAESTHGVFEKRGFLGQQSVAPPAHEPHPTPPQSPWHSS